MASWSANGRDFLKGGGDETEADWEEVEGDWGLEGRSNWAITGTAGLVFKRTGNARLRAAAGDRVNAVHAR